MLYKKCIEQVVFFVLLSLIGISPSYAYERFGADQHLSNIALEKYDREKSIHVPMRDGIDLAADIIFPKGAIKNLSVFPDNLGIGEVSSYGSALVVATPKLVVETTRGAALKGRSSTNRTV
jgi:hypothetical protein